MNLKSRWEIAKCTGDCLSKYSFTNDDLTKEKIIELIATDLLTIHFQPIFSSQDGTVFGYEALARINGDHTEINIPGLFKKAIQTGTISCLDMKCRELAMKLASTMGINSHYLFINVCPETLIDPSHSLGVTDKLVDTFGFTKDKIILEITEESAVPDCGLLQKVVNYYKKRGYKIAIDDFGAGYGGLKMLSMVEPEFIKIDKHFVSNIDKSVIKFNLVDAISSACHRMGIKVIAEGIEREEELRVMLKMGIELLQGYLLGRPSESLWDKKVTLPLLNDLGYHCLSNNGEYRLIGDIATKIYPIPPTAHISDAFNIFIKNTKLRSLPIVKDERIVGILHRTRFLENNILGKYGYGVHLNSKKFISEIAENPSLLVEYDLTLEEVAQRIQVRKFEFLYDDICVTKNGFYFGIVPVSLLLDAITERSLVLAKNSNPLTGLPGNESIQREIYLRLAQNIPFDVCYIDVDNFKPYNDHYGFEKGDQVIKTLAHIIKDAINPEDSKFSFIGHIGGDDFILITPPHLSLPTCEKIIKSFEAQLLFLHGKNDYEMGYYVSKNRKNMDESFPLLSISIGIVSTEISKFDSFAHLASIATEVKKAAKISSATTRRSSIVRDRRVSN